MKFRLVLYIALGCLLSLWQLLVILNVVINRPPETDLTSVRVGRFIGLALLLPFIWLCFRSAYRVKAKMKRKQEEQLLSGFLAGHEN